MPAAANIAINDGKATPVTHTFAPDQKLATGEFIFANRAATILDGMETLTVKVVKPKGKNAAARVIGQLRLPTTGLVDGVEQVTRFDTLNFDWNFSKDGTTAGRKDARTLFRNLLDNASFQAVVDNVESYY